jgi:hypothetical protein
MGSVGGMGAAGTVSGVMTGDVPVAEPVSTPPALPGDLVVVDPDTGQQATTFITDDNGELTIEVQPGSGGGELQTEVAITIGDETYVVDLEEAEPTGALEVTFDHVNFTDPSTDLRSTATITPDFGGTPTSVIWSIDTVVNKPALSFWKRDPDDPHGLIWGDVPPDAGQTNWETTPVLGSPPSGAAATAKLTDIVGDRVVTVRAEAVVDGSTVIKLIDVRYGHGPLSVFTGKIILSQWATATDWNTFPYLTDPSDFPAATACGGTVVPSVELSAMDQPATFGDGWTPSYAYGAYSNTSKLPTYWQLYYVTRSDSLGNPKKGAALAAGWVLTPYYYWTNEVVHNVPSAFFLGVSASLVTGWNLGEPMNSPVYTACVY